MRKSSKAAKQQSSRSDLGVRAPLATSAALPLCCSASAPPGADAHAWISLAAAARLLAVDGRAPHVSTVRQWVREGRSVGRRPSRRTARLRASHGTHGYVTTLAWVEQFRAAMAVDPAQDAGRAARSRDAVAFLASRGIVVGGQSSKSANQQSSKSESQRAGAGSSRAAASTQRRRPAGGVTAASAPALRLAGV